MTLPIHVLLGYTALLSASLAAAPIISDTVPLSRILVSGEDWSLVAEGYQFTDAACADAAGNFYFTDVAKGTTINRVSPDGKLDALVSDTPRISGLKFGPDGRLYACTQSPKKQVVAFEVPSGKVTVLADDVQPNDLVVSRKGNVYFTETGKGQVTLIAPGGTARSVATGIRKPNGISLSPGQETLVVSEYGGTNVWAFRVQDDGTLAPGTRPIVLQTPVGKTDSLGDGMTTDRDGRYYVTSALGIQVFDSEGKFVGIIANPQQKGTVSVAFAGPDLSYLYAASSDKIYRRKTKVRGALFFK